MPDEVPPGYVIVLWDMTPWFMHERDAKRLGLTPADGWTAEDIARIAGTEPREAT